MPRYVILICVDTLRKCVTETFAAPFLGHHIADYGARGSGYSDR